MKLEEMFGGAASKVQMVDRIINILRNEDPDVVADVMVILNTIGIDDTMDVSTMEDVLMRMDMGDERDNRQLARLYQKLQPMMEH